MPEIQVFESPEALYTGAAEEIARSAEAATLQKGRFSIALSGGSTPRGVYERLAESQCEQSLPWKETHFFWGDERHVPPEHPESNFGIAWEALLSKVAVPSRNIHRIPAEVEDPLRAAKLYEDDLLQFFRYPPGGWPRFDLILLGVGTDGHTASLFPGTEALSVDDRSVAPNWVESLASWRITLTLPAINHAERVIVLAAGGEKAGILRKALREPGGETPLPIQRVRPLSEGLVWMVDREAGRGIL
ncbi:MAG TPA: 6-phosphogluconolactonase [Anaerolineales bacterium]|nr:6-phosphogluconolactonase [Anaerolineales bacterium]